MRQQEEFEANQAYEDPQDGETFDDTEAMMLEDEIDTSQLQSNQEVGIFEEEDFWELFTEEDAESEAIDGEEEENRQEYHQKEDEETMQDGNKEITPNKTTTSSSMSEPEFDGRGAQLNMNRQTGMRAKIMTDNSKHMEQTAWGYPSKETTEKGESSVRTPVDPTGPPREQREYDNVTAVTTRDTASNEEQAPIIKGEPENDWISNKARIAMPIMGNQENEEQKKR